MNEVTNIKSNILATMTLKQNEELDESAKKLADIAKQQKGLAVQAAAITKQQQKDYAAQKANIQAYGSAQEDGSITVSEALKYFEDCNKDAEHYHGK